MSTTSRAGLFLTFEGLDGCGKTTQLHRLAERLRAEGETVIETVEPGGTAIGGAIRRILLDPAHEQMGATAELLLYFAARAQNVDEIVTPATRAGTIVLSDRWTDSSWAYQGFGRGLGTPLVNELDRIACRGRRPDLTFWVDIDLATGLQRARHRNTATETGETRMDEQEEAFYERVLEGYRTLAEAEPARVVRVDGNGSPDEVAERVWAIFSNFRSARRV